MKTLEYPAYSASTASITVRDPERGAIFATERKVQNMLMANSTFRTTIQERNGRLIDFVFNLYCMDDYKAAVLFFQGMNGDYLRYDTDFVIQLLSETVTVDDVGRGHWQFALSGLLFPHDLVTHGGGGYPTDTPPW